MKLTSNLLQNQEDDSSTISTVCSKKALIQMRNTKTKKNPGKRTSSKTKSLKQILISLEDQEKLDQEEEEEEEDSIQISQQEISLFEANYKKKSETMLDLGESDHQTKRSRLSSTSSDKLIVSTVSLSKISNQSGVGVGVGVGGGVGVGVGGGGGGGGGSGSGHHRRLWVKDRSKAWWDSCNHPDFPESEFRKAFRMGRSTFDMICQELNSVVAKENTMLRAAIPVQQRVAVCIWRLATGEPLRLVSKRFGLGISTCHKLVLEVCSAIKTVLMPKFLQWPDDETLDKIKTEYELISGIPNVVGSMYTTHIPIIAPKISVSAYFNKRHTERNQKTSYSITVQGVVDHKGVFTDCCIGWPGSMPDDQILEKSALFQRANGGLLNGVWIVGSSGYPLMDWVLVPYTHQHLTWTQHAFNEKIKEIQRISKEAFARLKMRWSCLQKRTEVKLQDLPVVLGACCVLHNICEMRNDEMDPESRFELYDDEIVPENSLRSASSMQTRDNIAHNLLHHGLAGTTFL